MNVVMYLRKSRADIELEANGEMETLARHEKILLDIAKKQKLNITAIYKEIVSGETISARPVMQKLIEEVEAGKWNGVLVMEIERLARGDTIDQGIVARSFKAENTKIITPTKTYDPSNEFDEEYFEFGLFMSRREYKTINRRIQRGRIQSAKDGKYLGSVPPFGYDKVKIENDKGYTLKPNDEADAVRLIYDMYTNGDGCTVIANKLDKLHIKPRIGEYWSRASIMDILKNPVYKGKICWSKGNQNILVDGLHLPIIDKDIFGSVQNIRESQTHTPTKANFELRNPFAGLIYCKKCGAMLTRLGITSHCNYDTIKCSNRYCNNVSAPIYLVEKRLILELWKWFEKYKVTIADNELDDISKLELAKKESIKQMHGDVEKINIQIEKTYELLEQGIYTTEIFLLRSETLTNKKSALLKAISELESEIKRSDNLPRIDISATETLLNTYFKLDSIEGKNRILKTLLNRIEYGKDTPNRRGHRENDNFQLRLYPKLPVHNCHNDV